MGWAAMAAFWFAAGFAVRSWWVLLGPLAVGAAVLAAAELVPDLDDRRIGDWLVYLGGGEEFWYLAFLFEAPLFVLAAALGHWLRERVQPSQVVLPPD